MGGPDRCLAMYRTPLVGEGAVNMVSAPIVARERGIKIYDTIPEMLKHVDVVLLEKTDAGVSKRSVLPVV